MQNELSLNDAGVEIMSNNTTIFENFIEKSHENGVKFEALHSSS